MSVPVYIGPKAMGGEALTENGSGNVLPDPGGAAVARPSAEEERELAARARAGDGSAARLLVESHMPFVAGIARRYSRYGLPVNDLVQEGVIGLIQAIRRYNPASDARLATYAMLWVRAAMRDHVVRSWSVVRIGTTARQKALFFRLRRLASDLGSGIPSLDGERVDETVRALAQRFAMPSAEVLALTRRIGGRDRPLEHRPGDLPAPSLSDRLVDPCPSPEEATIEKKDGHFWRSLLAQGLESLPHRERVIIQRRHLAEAKCSFAAIAAELGLSKERVRQLEATALERLRTFIVAASGGGYARGVGE